MFKMVHFLFLLLKLRKLNVPNFSQRPIHSRWLLATPQIRKSFDLTLEIGYRDIEKNSRKILKN